MTDIAVTSTTYLPADRPWLIGEAVGHQAPTLSTDFGVIDFSLFNSGLHYPNGFLPSGLVVGAVTSGSRLGPYLTSANEAQTVTITGAPTGGTFTLTFDGETTAAIAYNAVAATVKTALEGLSNIAPGDVAVTGGPGPGTAYVVTFTGVRAGADVPAMTATGSFTGGTSPAVAVSTTTAGGATSPDGRERAVGLLYNAVPVPSGAPQSRKVAVAYVRSFAVVSVSRLPANHGLDAAAQAALKLIDFRA